MKYEGALVYPWIHRSFHKFVVQGVNLNDGLLKVSCTCNNVTVCVDSILFTGMPTYYAMYTCANLSSTRSLKLKSVVMVMSFKYNT